MKLTRKKHKAEVPSVAMGDIAFNLLIFFVILAKAQDDSHLNWTPASSSKVESAGVSKVSVLINSENKLHLCISSRSACRNSHRASRNCWAILRRATEWCC